MAYASDMLRDRRMGKTDPNQDPADPMGGDKTDGKPNARSIQLSDEELKSLAGSYEPGAEAECLVKGRISQDGKLDVISISPVGGQQQGAGQDPGSMRMNPMMMPG